MTTRLARWLLAATLMATVAACGGKDNDAEKCVTTNDAARQGVISRMQQSADGLPWPVTFTKQLPGVSTSVLSPGPVPGNTNDTDPEQPYSWSYPLWVLLPSGVTATQAVDAFADGWRKQQFAVTERSNGDVQAEDGDGYAYVTRTSVQDDLSLVLESPCFPKSQLNESAAWPDKIESNG